MEPRFRYLFLHFSVFRKKDRQFLWFTSLRVLPSPTLALCTPSSLQNKYIILRSIGEIDPLIH